MKNITVNVLKAPAIQMRIDGESVTDSESVSYEESAQLKLRCEADSGVPDEIRSYTWSIGDTTLNDNSSIINFTANRRHHMALRCSVDHQAFDIYINNNDQFKDHIVKFPYGSQNQILALGLEAEMNPKPSRVLHD